MTHGHSEEPSNRLPRAGSTTDVGSHCLIQMGKFPGDHSVPGLIERVSGERDKFTT